MILSTNQTSMIYSKGSLEFVTVAQETCLFLENSDQLEKSFFIDKTLKLLSLLYLKASLLDIPESESDESSIKSVTELDWQLICNKIANVLADDDMYLDYFDSEMKETHEPVEKSLAENLADIYQDLKDFTLAYRLEIPDLMHNALIDCINSFKTYWGYRVVDTIRILHWVYYRENDENTFNLSKKKQQPGSRFFIK